MNLWRNIAVGVSAISLICSGAVIDNVFAQSKSSSSSSSSSSSGYSKPSSSSSSTTTSKPTPNTTTPSTGSAAKSPASTSTSNKAISNEPGKSSHGYSKPGASAATSAATPKTEQPSSKSSSSALGAASNRKVSADTLKAYQDERKTASKPPMPVTKTETVNNPARTTYKNTDTYMQNRTTAVKNYQNTYPDISRYNSGMRPNYGVFDSNFLTGMMLGYIGSGLVNNSMWMYSHMNEPWYQSYRADLNAQAANNAELKAKVAAMDAEIAKLQESETSLTSTNTLPKEVDPALAIAPEAMFADDEPSSGMSWWWSVVFIIIGITVAVVAIKIFK